MYLRLLSEEICFLLMYEVFSTDSIHVHVALVTETELHEVTLVYLNGR